MATTLYFLDAPATTHRGTNTAKLTGATSGWTPKSFGLTVGPSLVTLDTVTVTVPTNGVEVASSGVPLEWISEPVAADVTISGTISISIYSSESSMSANVALNAVVDIIRATDNSITNIGFTGNGTELSTT